MTWGLIRFQGIEGISGCFKSIARRFRSVGRILRAFWEVSSISWALQEVGGLRGFSRRGR